MSLVRVADLGAVIRGVSWDKTEASDVPMPGLLPVLRAGNITDRLDTDNDLVWIPASNVSATQILRAGDIAICMSSGSASVVGKTAISQAAWNGSVGAFCAILRANPAICLPEYLAFYLKSPRFRSWTSEAQGANIKNIKKSALEDFKIDLPSLAEQLRIVDILSRAESIVRLRREAQQKAAELVPAIFLDMFGDPATNPKCWPTMTLDSVLTETKLGLVRGAKEMDDNFPFAYVRMDAVGMGEVDLASLRRVQANQKEVNEYSLKPGDVLFNTRNSKELVGKTGIYVEAKQEPVLFNNNLMRMRFDERLLDSQFVIALFQTSFVQSQLEERKRGTTSVFAIYFKDLRSIKLRIPSMALQKEFVEKDNAIRQIRTMQSYAIEMATTSFESLLAKNFGAT